MLEVRHLRIVKAIAKTGTVTGAARRLHLTQPAVSHALADLEARLGLKLFHRKPAGMVITGPGTRILETAAVVLEEVERAEADLRLHRTGRAGVLRLSTECYTCYHWLPPILAHLHDGLPEVEVEIVPDATSNPIGALLDGRLDMAIVHTPVSHEDVVFEPLFSDELVAAVPPDHPWATAEFVTVEDFPGQTVLFHSDPDQSPLMTEFLGPRGVVLSRVLILQLTDAVLASVRAGLGVTVMAGWALQPDVDAGALIPVRVGRDGLHRTWRLATLKDRSQRESIQEMAGVLKGELGRRRAG